MAYFAILRKALPLALLASLRLTAAGPAIQVYKTETCGCCGKWVDYLKANGFSPTVTNVPSTAEYRQRYGVPEKLASCHTAVVDGYAVEGHVPAADIHRLIKERPKAKGIAVPAMPIGSPGMEQGPRRQTYYVLLFDGEGKVSEYQKYPGN